MCEYMTDDEREREEVDRLDRFVRWLDHPDRESRALVMLEDAARARREERE